MTSPPQMTPAEFITKWRGESFRESAEAQSWFLDLLQLVGHLDPRTFGDEERFTFEKPVPGGSADAYLQDHFVWEFKGEEARLKDAFQQCLRYSVHLKTPPLLIVSSFQRIRIQTNFPGKVTRLYEIAIADLDKPEPFNNLSNIFFHPECFEPENSREELTSETAKIFGDIVAAMEEERSKYIENKADSLRLARFLNQVVFCLFAEDADLLKDKVFTNIVNQYHNRPDVFNTAINNLFTQMVGGGLFGATEIAHFNGDLFLESETVELSGTALLRLEHALNKNWRDIDASIFGTLFERALDASKRAQLGAHYTAAADILRVIEPVLLQPLRREWREVREAAEKALAREKRDDAIAQLNTFRQRLATLRVLDPACGSGNFLYLALRSLLDLEKEIIDFAAAHGWHDLLPSIQPDQFLGIETDTYAAELARTALWIGYIQWHQANGFPYNHSPLLTSLDSIQQRDAILTCDAAGQPVEPDWPAAEFIIGNPPFLGHRPFRQSLGDEYVNAVYSLYGDRIPNSSDLCCYWFEKARAQIESGKTRRAGLLATQSIRKQSSRPVLSRIKESGEIFTALSDEDWVLDGANVRISIVCFDDGSECERVLNGETVSSINADLTSGVDLTQAKRLIENQDISFMGVIKAGDFDITDETAKQMLAQPNPHGKPNSDVIKRWLIGRDINQRSQNMWIIDFGNDMSEADAALYEAPFEYIQENVRPNRNTNRDRRFKKYWWLHGCPRIEMRNALNQLNRYVAITCHSKHRVFRWINSEYLPSNAVIVFASDDEYFFGLLSSSYHRIWSLSLGSQLEDRSRYTPTTCFETFPFPRPSASQRQAIAAAAKRLNQLRENWLNPLDEQGRPFLEGSAELKRRTLTKLYNQNPTWLQNAHAELDAAVAAAYGWPPDLPEEEILARLLALNLARAVTSRP